MASRKRKLTRDEIEALLAQSSDSETYDSEFDDSDDEKSDSDADCSDSSDGTVDYNYNQSSDFSWSSTPSTRQRLAFSGQSGLQVTVDSPDDPLSFFNLFMTSDILDVIVRETNRRATQLASQAPQRPHARLTRLTYALI